MCIAGPTASGKSAAALALAKAVDGEIINTDALQVYRDIRILSARPTEDDMRSMPHHLYGVVDGTTHFSSGHFVRQVMPIVLNVLARRKVPILVGGTGLYFKALFDGLAPVPTIEPQLIKQIDNQIREEGIEAVLEEAKALDPVGVSRLLGHDSQRLTRLLSVVKQTGRPLHEWQNQNRPEVPAGQAMRFLILPPRETLYAKINERFERMVEQGGMNEAKNVYAQYGHKTDLPMLKAIGLSHLLRHLGGELNYVSAIDLAKRDTRRFAKRQMTWFRNQCRDWTHVEAIDVKNTAQFVNQWSST